MNPSGPPEPTEQPERTEHRRPTEEREPAEPAPADPGQAREPAPDADPGQSLEPAAADLGQSLGPARDADPADVRPGGPAAPPINAGVPASMPPGMAPFGPPSSSRSPYSDYPRSPSPDWGPPDPAAVAGPPWPELVATRPYHPPRLIRWPVVVALAGLAAWIGALIASTASGPTSTGTSLGWLAAHQAAVSQLNRDQAALIADVPSAGGATSKWAADWKTFHDDTVAAASIPNPGGAATVPWREMLNDYATGSATYLQALTTRNRGEILQAKNELDAGDQAARRFNQAMGLPTSQ